MQRLLVMLAALVCYGAFFASFVYFVGFLAGYPALPTHVDKGLSAQPAVAVVIDLGLIALFGLQHSVMARRGFKTAWSRIVPEPLERSIYCLATALALGAMFLLWHPITGSVWHVADPMARSAIWAVFLAGFGIVFVSTWLINHFELFGLAQAWSFWRGRELSPPVFVTPLFYRGVRHPIYLGFLIALWATPDMSVGHLLLSAGFTIYLLIGIRYEERDLAAHFGSVYVEYSARVGMIIPGIGKGLSGGDRGS